MSFRIILFRHGKTDSNLEHLYCGSTDISLCESGVNEIRNKMDSYPDISFCRIICSGLKRTKETFELIYGQNNFAYEVDENFNEMDFGMFENKGYEVLKEVPEYQNWVSGDNEKNICPGGESGEIMRKRVVRSFSEIVSKKRDCAIFTHGGPVVAVMEYLFPNENKNRYQWQCECGCGYIINFSDSEIFYGKF